MYDIIDLNSKLVGELREIAKELNIPKFETLKKQELVYKILDQQAMSGAKDASKDSDKPKRGRKPKSEETPALFNEESKVDSRFVDLEGTETKKPEEKPKLPEPDLSAITSDGPKN